MLCSFKFTADSAAWQIPWLTSFPALQNVDSVYLVNDFVGYFSKMNNTFFKHKMQTEFLY